MFKDSNGVDSNNDSLADSNIVSNTNSVISPPIQQIEINDRKLEDLLLEMGLKDSINNLIPVNAIDTVTSLRLVGEEVKS